MPNILVTGSSGQLGSELQELHQSYPQFSFLFTDRETLDITDKAAVESTCKRNNITHIINCAAYTAVDKAEEEQQSADTINHIAVQYLAEVAAKQHISLIHISTDYVFDGTSCTPYIESDATNPQGIYGKTKLDGENALLRAHPSNSIIIRTSWVYSSFGNNFVKTMLKLGKERDTLNVVYDQIGTPTYAADLAMLILDILPHIPKETVSIYHYSNEGVCSWYDFTKAIFEFSNISCRVDPIESKEYPTAAKRPNYGVLNKNKIKNHYNIVIPYWHDSLQRCLKQIEVKKQ